MTRITNPAVAFFPVELRELHCDMSEERGGFRKVPDHRAVVDMKTGRVFTVVTKNYRLVTNEEAFKAGQKAWASVFDELGVDVSRDMDVFNVVMPKSRSFCHIDLIHREYRSAVWEQEFWLPFVRVTNSYNKKYALHFDLGFVRELCNNGMIFRKATIQYKEPHLHHRIHDTVKFVDRPGWFREMEQDFLRGMDDLRRLQVPQHYDQALMAKALGLQFDDLALAGRKRSAAEERRLKTARKNRQWFKSLAGDLCRNYREEFARRDPKLGQHLNAYAIFNAATDFASRQHDELPLGLTFDGMQRAVGAWAESFPRVASSADFSYAVYLGPLVEQLEVVAHAMA